ncbi:basic proline-rich protein-like [Prinia subflava]|uniref:basic proline-rich protein-like n=1 Tax=Prinia subflava TaxID=208062 RepID=UPI002FE2DC62
MRWAALPPSLPLRRWGWRCPPAPPLPAPTRGAGAAAAAPAPRPPPGPGRCGAGRGPGHGPGHLPGPPAPPRPPGTSPAPRHCPGPSASPRPPGTARLPASPRPLGIASASPRPPSTARPLGTSRPLGIAVRPGLPGPGRGRGKGAWAQGNGSRGQMMPVETRRTCSQCTLMPSEHEGTEPISIAGVTGGSQELTLLEAKVDKSLILNPLHCGKGKGCSEICISESFPGTEEHSCRALKPLKDPTQEERDLP